MNLDKHRIEQIKNSVNIVDIINSYVPLKNNGKNHFACCPFHNEKTPSFTVEENNQFYHCFGCGAHGDVIGFVMAYEGLEFIDALKRLDSTLEFMPSESINKNIKRASYKTAFKLPESHKQNKVKSEKAISYCLDVSLFGLEKYIHDTAVLYPIYTAENELVNMVVFKYGQPRSFIAGGPSYNGFTPIIKNESKNFVACVSLADGRLIAETYNVNVAVCWDELVMKYICIWNNGNLNIKPAIRDCDDDYLCYEMDWIKLSPGDANKNIKIKNMGVLI